MTPLVIILIVIGAGILLFSCFVVDKNDKDNDSYLMNQRELSLSELEGIKQKVEAVINEAAEEAMSKTEDRLSRISNEKIIAVDDFSNQIMEKISQNHEEVVFLYNMLNEKESEIKETVKNFDKLKKQLSEADKNKPANTKRKSNSANSSRKAVHDVLDAPGGMDAEPDFLNNNNQKILEMYSQGFSLIDISRTLELGQGEVKLVIDLYRDK